MYQILPPVCCYQDGNRDMDSARIENSTVTFTRQLPSTGATEPRLFLKGGLFLGIKALVKGFKFFTPEIKGGICIVKYMLMLENPDLATMIDVDWLARWLHAWRMYLTAVLYQRTAEEEAIKLATKERIEAKLQESLGYERENRGENSNMNSLGVIFSDENLFAIPRNITNYANEGESYDTVYPKCLRTSSRGKMTNSPCRQNSENAPHHSANSAKINHDANVERNSSSASWREEKYYEGELRVVNMVMNYMELQPNQLLNLKMSHCLNFYTFGLLTRVFDGFLRR
ncbi:hypothetical protein DMENIID0001_142800 [Sergentomyia squamirostris]